MVSSKIKLCIIHPNLRCGGSEKFISTICNRINTNLFDIELYIFDNKHPFYQITNPSVRIVELQIENVRKSLPAILKIVKKSKPDILFTASNHLNIFLCIFKFLLPQKLKLVARESSIVSINNKRSKYGKLYEILVKRFYKNIDFIICQSVYMQNDLVQNYNIKKEKTAVIYNPVENIVKDEMVPPGAGTVYKFLTVGRLSPEKGIDRLLKALSLLTIDFAFYIIGDGPQKTTLQELAVQLGLKDKVFFEGERSYPYKGLTDANLCLIGSYYEGLPNAVLEAGMLGIPVVGFNAPGGISEIINNGINGFLVNDDDNTGIAFSDAIMKALVYNFDKNQIIEITRKKFSTHWIMGQIESCFQSIHRQNARKDKIAIFIDRVAPKNYLQLKCINDLGFFPECFVTEPVNSSPEIKTLFSQHVLRKSFLQRVRQVFRHVAHNKKMIHHIEIYPGGRFTFLYLLVAKFYRLKCICIERGDLLYYNKKGYGIITRFSMWVCYKFSNAVWYKEPYMKPILEKFNQNLIFIHNAIGTKADVNTIGPEEKDITFLWMNRAIPQRRSDWFIDVLKKPELEFTKNYFIGLLPSTVYSAEENYIKNNKPGNLTIESYCSNPEDYYKRAKYFVLPSEVVFANHSLLESMSYGVVPIVSDQIGTSLIVTNGVNGFVFDHTKINFEKTILKALETNDEDYMRLSAAASEKIEKYFSEKIFKEALRNMYSLFN